VTTCVRDIGSVPVVRNTPAAGLVNGKGYTPGTDHEIIEKVGGHRKNIAVGG